MANRRTEIRWRANILEALGDFHSHEDAFHISVAREHIAQDSVGTPNETRDCDAFSATVNTGNRAIGCWEDAVKPIIKKAWLAGTYNESTDNVYRVPQQEFATRFGEEVSIKREQAIADLLRRTILLSKAERTVQVDAFAMTLNDIKITWQDGNGYVQIIYPDGTREPTRRLFPGNYIIFDAPAQVIIDRITQSDTTGTLFDLAIAPKHKGVITATGGTEEREVITRTAADDYAFTNPTYDEFNAKITGKANLHLDIAAA